MKNKFKEYCLKEDIIIPKGTIFTECYESRYVNPYVGDLGLGMKNSTVSVLFTKDALDEIGDKFEEVQEKKKC